MSQEFQDLMQNISEAIANRTITHLPLKKMELYKEGLYNPFFSLVIRDGKVCCIWCGNRKMIPRNGDVLAHKEDEIERLGRIKCTEGLTAEEWDDTTIRVMHALGLKL